MLMIFNQVCSKLVANQESSMTNDAPTIHIVSWQDQIHEAARYTSHQMNFAREDCTSASRIQGLLESIMIHGVPNQSKENILKGLRVK